jgi:hypothetical protein
MNPSSETTSTPFYHRLAVKVGGVIALLVPVAYLTGRYATGFHLSHGWSLLANVATAIAFGALLGIPIGLFYGSLKSQMPGPIMHHFHPSFVNQQDKILEQIKGELGRNQELLRTRIGDAMSITSLRYDTSFWAAVKASGQLFVMQEPQLLATLARTYYWLEEANRLESLAFESHFSTPVHIENESATTHLLEQVRLLDGVLGTSINAATSAIDVQLATDQATPPAQATEPVMAHTETN